MHVNIHLWHFTSQKTQFRAVEIEIAIKSNVTAFHCDSFSPRCRQEINSRGSLLHAHRANFDRQLNMKIAFSARGVQYAALPSLSIVAIHPTVTMSQQWSCVRNNSIVVVSCSPTDVCLKLYPHYGIWCEVGYHVHGINGLKMSVERYLLQNAIRHEYFFLLDF